ncbi:hypothetical protein TNCV_1096541 [Trichonephila clavipes]|nr:hypothetical protein TNCV_1096541 [Trichonephila clavipes]
MTAAIAVPPNRIRKGGRMYISQENDEIRYFVKSLMEMINSLDLIRVVEDLDGTVESMDTIAKLKTKIEKSSTFESDTDFVKTLIKNCIDERISRNEREVTLKKQKISTVSTVRKRSRTSNG